MPRAKLETAFLGDDTLAILNAVPAEQAGWIIKALAGWILHDIMPADDQVPAACVGSWTVIVRESQRIHDALEARRYNGAKGGRPPKVRDAKTGKETKGKPKGNRKGNRKGTKGEPKGNRDEDRDEDIYTSGKPDASMQPTSGCVGRRTSVLTAPDFSSDAVAGKDATLHDEHFLAWAQSLKDPVDAALDTTGEPPRGLARRTYGAALKALGRERFVEEVAQFRAELEAGETVRNRGAALTKRLKDRVAAKTALDKMRTGK